MKCWLKYMVNEGKAKKNILTKSGIEFFHSKNDFKKNIYKNIAKKKL